MKPYSNSKDILRHNNFIINIDIQFVCFLAKKCTPNLNSIFLGLAFLQIELCNSKVTKQNFLEVEASLWLNERSQNVAKGDCLPNTVEKRMLYLYMYLNTLDLSWKKIDVKLMMMMIMNSWPALSSWPVKAEVVEYHEFDDWNYVNGYTLCIHFGIYAYNVRVVSSAFCSSFFYILPPMHCQKWTKFGLFPA